MRFLYGFTGSAASKIWFSEKFYKFKKNRKPVARRNVVGGIAQSPHGHCAKADPRTGCVQFSCEGRSPARVAYNFPAKAAETAQQLH